MINIFYRVGRSSYRVIHSVTKVTAIEKCKVNAFSTAPLNYKIFKIQDEADFEERVVKSKTPVVVDFQASWCNPCKILEPRLETIIGNTNEKAHLAKVDIDDNADLAMKHDVQAVPHVLGYKNGKPSKSFFGVKDEDEIEKFVSELIAS